MIIDGIASVDWAMKVAQVPADRIILLGQSLGTGVTAAVAEHFAKKGVDFAGVVLVAGFTTIPELLPEYSIGGYLPALSPLRPYPILLRLLTSYIVDKWPSTERLANFARLSKKMKLFIIHARDDWEIPWTQSNKLFAAAANATTDGGMSIDLFEKVKARSTIDMGDGAFVSTWKTGENKIIRQEVLAYGRE